MKYKIFIKYTSTFKKDFYEVYKVKSEDGQEIEFVTSDLDELKATISELDKIYGHELIRVVIDITYNISISSTFFSIKYRSKVSCAEYLKKLV